MINIIMCTYNGERYISEQIQSIVDSTVKDWRLMIFDDQSIDHTIECIKYYQKKYSGKIYYKINQKKQGVVLNFLKSIYEVGVQMKEHDLIMLCDQDDHWNRDKIQKTANGMKQLIQVYGNKIPLLVCTDVTVVDEMRNVLNPSFRNMNHYQIKKMDLSHLLMENKVQGCTVMLNKSLAGMLDRLPHTAVMHDSWLALIAVVFGRIKYIDEPTMQYRQHTGNLQGSISYKEDVKNKFSNLRGQRQIVMKTTPQATEFLKLYRDVIPVGSRSVIKAFATLPRQNFVLRRYHIIRYHMWKSGMLRNIGLMVLI
ncbi:MAG: glycosyltransferase family 2 protein [Lachnospiraceae bacterium]|nr:glycosyltransferase family 2 protein [Lachnospiraceae bacterium]